MYMHWTRDVTYPHSCGEEGLFTAPKMVHLQCHGWSGEGGFFFWTRFENLVAKRRKINDRVVPILVANVIGMMSYGCQDPRKSLSLPSVLLLDV